MADIRLSDVNSFLSEVKDRHHVSRRDHERATQRLRCQLKLIQRRRALSHALDLLQKQPAGHQLGGEWNIEQTSLASTSCQEDPLHNAISALQEAMGVLDYGVTTSDRMYQIAHHVKETLQLGPSMASKHSMHHESVQKTSNQTSCSAVCWVGPRQRHQDVSHKITVSQAYDEVFEQRARQRSISKRAKLVRQRLIERQKEEEATGLRLEAHENKLNDLRAKVAPQLTRSWEQAVGGTRSSWASDQSSMQQELCELMGLAPGSMGDCTSKTTLQALKSLGIHNSSAGKLALRLSASMTAGPGA